MPFQFEQTELPGVVIVEPGIHADDRGFFMETFKASEFAAAALPTRFVQENHSRSVQGTLRGLHFQRSPREQGKLVRVIEGEVFDVSVDVRPESPTFRRWVGVKLSAGNRRSVFVPAGYAHGFCVLSAAAQVVYKTTEEYAPELEWGVAWNDPLLAIAWPIRDPRLSARDSRWPPLEMPG
jgi:dTDP-4-dehydrorhamnose 3,5-epimerase